MPHCVPLLPAPPPAFVGESGRRPGRPWHWRGCQDHALRAARVGRKYHAWGGLLSSNTWAKIVVLLLSIKIPHAMSSGVPSCSDAHSFPGYLFVNVALKLLSIKSPVTPSSPPITTPALGSEAMLPNPGKKARP